MTRARDLADSADKDIAGTLTLDGLTVDGNVGIGTSSPQAPIHAGNGSSGVSSFTAGTRAIIEGTATTYLTIAAPNTSLSGILFADPDDSDNGFIKYDHSSSGVMSFGTGGSGEAMRIDSSGNLLVGTTSAYGVGGATITAGGLVYSSVSGDKAAEFNRNTSDGDIVKFNKDGSTVGIIGSSNSDLTIGNSDVGLKFHDANNTIYPWNVGSDAASDGQLNLGAGSIRFKDLYLSGGVYLGGTGSANKLDDYEEGTWTPDLRFSGGSTGITYSQTPQGEYTKIGNMVIARGEIRLSNKGSSTGQVSIYGLPFTPSIVVDWEGGFVTNWANLRSVYSVPVPNISNGITNFSLRAASVGVTTGAEFNDPAMTNSNIDNDFILGFTLNYRTA